MSVCKVQRAGPRHTDTQAGTHGHRHTDTDAQTQTHRHTHTHCILRWLLVSRKFVGSRWIGWRRCRTTLL